jgi:hypothetical protein
MIPVIYVRNNLENAYEDCTLWGSVKDRFKIQHDGDIYIKDLKLQITKVLLPPNFYEKAYLKNMFIASKRVKFKESVLAPKTNRVMDFKLFMDFQKKFFGYSVAKSIELMLRVKRKSIKNSCIVIYDAAESTTREVLYEIAKKAEYIVLVSKKLSILQKLQENIMAEFGVTPIITMDIDFAMKCADFVICSEKYTNANMSPVWYINNNYIPEEASCDNANDVVYKTPWDSGDISMSPEVLGAILYQMQEKDVEKALKYNGIYLSEIRFNDSIL